MSAPLDIADYVRSRCFTAVEIANAFGVPAHLLMVEIDFNRVRREQREAQEAEMRRQVTRYLRRFVLQIHTYKFLSEWKKGW